MAVPTSTAATARQAVRPRRLLAVALIVGVGGELAMHNTVLHGAPAGLGFTIGGVAAAACLVLGGVWLGRQPSPAATLLSAFAAVFAILVSWRAAPELAAANMAATAGLLIGATYLYRGRRLGEVALSEYPAAGMRTIAGTIAGPTRFASAHSGQISRPHLARLRPVLRGLALAAAPLALFAILFASADAVFADVVGRLFSVEVSFGSFAAGSLLAAGFAWIALGALWYAVTHNDYPEPDDAAPAPRLGRTEAAVLVGAVDLLFLGFVAIQFAYLFGGRATVASTGGLTYAEYARQGFFQLLVVAGLAVGLVLVIDHLANAASSRSKVVDRLHLMLVGLTGIVLASAVVRLDAYMDEFGLTKLRLYAAAALVWVAFLLVWVAVTVIRGRRSRFPAGAFLAGLVVIAALNAVNPDARIAEVNLDRHLNGVRDLDVSYAAGSLGPDATPVLVAGLDALPPCDAGRLAAAIVIDADEREGGWRSFNLGRHRAERLLRSAEVGAALEVACDGP